MKKTMKTQQQQQRTRQRQQTATLIRTAQQAQEPTQAALQEEVTDVPTSGQEAQVAIAAVPSALPPPPPVPAAIPPLPAVASYPWAWPAPGSMAGFPPSVPVPAIPGASPAVVYDPAIRQLVIESEQRTMQAIEAMRSEVRTELRNISSHYAPMDRVQDRWQTQDAQISIHTQQIADLQTAISKIEISVGKMPTRDDLISLLKEAQKETDREHPSILQVEHMIETAVEKQTSEFVTMPQVKTAIEGHQVARRMAVKDWVLWAAVVLAFLQGAGIIHPLAFFTGK